MSSSTSLPLLTGRVTLEEALEDEDDVLQKLSYPEKRLDFCGYLHTHANEIEAIVSHHLGVPKESCSVPWVNEWLHGSFNVCIPVYVNGAKKAMIRFPLPYKVGESTYPGNAAEKLRVEAATYAWIQSNCPSVPIPRLWGFAFPSGASCTALSRAPLLSRLGWYLRRSIAWMLGRPIPSRYVVHQHRQNFTSGYLLVDYVDNGRMLSETWRSHHGDSEKRRTLFRDLSRIMVSLARVPLPRIGSLMMDDGGVVALANRPLMLQLHQLENEGIPTHIPRDVTYTTTDTYVADLLGCHDSRIRHRPNSVLDQGDVHAKLSALTMMRAFVPHFTDRGQRQGPFTLMLTDLHQSNIFVDENWHITSLVDLEWACALPAEMLHPPYWLTGHAIDDITDDYLEEYRKRHGEFMAIFEEEEEKEEKKRSIATARVPFADRMRTGWNSGAFWYFHALQSFTGLYHLFIQHIRPLYGELDVDEWDDFERLVAPYWAPGVPEFVRQKMGEREQYVGRVRRLFQQSAESPGGHGRKDD